MRAQTLVKLKISSPSFENGDRIPEQHTCDGKNMSPALSIEYLPEGTQSLVLIVDDPDSPGANWTNWLMWDIPPTTNIEAGSTIGRQGRNNFGNQRYDGPCPSIGTHRYFFRLYALDTLLRLPEGSSRDELLNSMSNHILASGELMCVYSR